jgi:hypothetical protein
MQRDRCDATNHAIARRRRAVSGLVDPDCRVTEGGRQRANGCDGRRMQRTAYIPPVDALAAPLLPSTVIVATRTRR